MLPLFDNGLPAQPIHLSDERPVEDSGTNLDLEAGEKLRVVDEIGDHGGPHHGAHDLCDPTAVGLPADVADYTTTLDIDWENTFTANITKVITVKLYIRWVYDKYDNTVKPVIEDGVLVNETDVHQAIRKKGQYKQSLALGFGYTFN